MGSAGRTVEYHLLPTGWSVAPMEFDPLGWIMDEAPADRLLTVAFRENVFSGFSARTSAQVEVFADNAAIGLAIARFGCEPCPESASAIGWAEWLRRADIPAHGAMH